MGGVVLQQHLAFLTNHCRDVKWRPKGIGRGNDVSCHYCKYNLQHCHQHLHKYPYYSLTRHSLYQFPLRIPSIYHFSLLPPHASVSGSGGAQYSEILLGSETKKKESIAGIDQDELLDPSHLADPDTCFCEFRGVQIHHKIYEAEPQAHNPPQTQSIIVPHLPHQSSNKIGFPMILLHGFGASVYSWGRVMKPLAEVLGSKVLAVDRPAFGLTSRVDRLKHLSSADSQDTKPLNPYSMAFSVLATLYFIDFLAAEKVVLVGHSAGSLIAVDTYFEAPERVAALILVAPAIFAPLAGPKATKRNKSRGDKSGEEENPGPDKLGEQFVKLLWTLSLFVKYVSSAILQIIKGMTSMLSSLYKKALAAILRSAFGIMLIRMVIDKFGVAAVRYAWYDTNQVSEHVLNDYTKPLRTKGWDKALAEFTATTLATIEAETKSPLTKRLHEITCPVLIVTGDTDRIVPGWNAERLSRAIPGSCLEVIKNCGHLPHEEKVEEFVSVVHKFLQMAFGDQEEPSLAAAAAV